MAATTYLQIRNEIAAIGPFDTAAQTTRVGLWANQAQHWFLSKRRWSFLETSATVASISGQADYVLAGTSPIVTDFGQLIDISHNQANAGTTFVKLRYLDQQTFDDVLGVAGATPGIPIFYTIRGGAPQTTSATIVGGGSQKLSVWPVMNFVGALHAAYFRSVAGCQMTADTDVSIVPEEWLPAIITRAAGYGLTTKGQVLQGQELMQLADQLAAQAVQADTIARRGDEPPEDQATVGTNQPPNPNAGGNPPNSPYGWRAA
jgi:hypothetical protein